MINSYQQGVQKQMNDCEDIPYDLSYDDMDSFVRSCGVILPDSDSRDAESVSRIVSFI